MIKTVVREHKWPPEVIGGLSILNEDTEDKGTWFDDIESLDFWYRDVIECYKKVK